MRQFVVFFVVAGRSHVETVYATGLEDAKNAISKRHYGSKVEIITVARK